MILRLNLIKYTLAKQDRFEIFIFRQSPRYPLDNLMEKSVM